MNSLSSDYDSYVEFYNEQNRQSTLQAIAEQRQIGALVHFTRVENLAGILDHGLLSRAELIKRNLNMVVSDNIRLDNRLNGISLSVSFPNSKMFYRKRSDNPNSEWVVLVIDPAVIWKKACAFYKDNAASGHMSYIPVSALQSPSNFLDMFEQTPERQQQALLDCDTTNVQAEVLVFDSIAPEDIKIMEFSNRRTAMHYCRQIKPPHWSLGVGINEYGFFEQRELVRRRANKY